MSGDTNGGALTAPEIKVTVGETVYTLSPTLERCVQVCEVFDGVKPLLRSLDNGNFVVAAQLIAIGAGLTLQPAERMALAIAVRDAGVSDAIYAPLVRYAIQVFGGGVDEDAKPGEAEPRATH